MLSWTVTRLVPRGDAHRSLTRAHRPQPHERAPPMLSSHRCPRHGLWPALRHGRAQSTGRSIARSTSGRPRAALSREGSPTSRSPPEGGGSVPTVVLRRTRFRSDGHGLGRRRRVGVSGSTGVRLRAPVGGSVETISGSCRLFSARSIAATRARGADRSMGIEKTRLASALHTGHMTDCGAVPIGLVMSNVPSRSH
jgi:hypothetical protein